MMTKNGSHQKGISTILRDQVCNLLVVAKKESDSFVCLREIQSDAALSSKTSREKSKEIRHINKSIEKSLF